MALIAGRVIEPSHIFLPGRIMASASAQCFLKVEGSQGQCMQSGGAILLRAAFFVAKMAV
ncbi:MAG: hypothetical protein EA346_13190 [Thioalkalivibrio sp.]|nr:MAG: hypothetical protein EA346_13190 [Thioalkalivibrio sp.]